MPSSAFPYGLYLVTDEAACLGRDFYWVLEEALKGGVQMVQLREKQLSMQAFLERAQRVQQLTDRYQVPLIINDALPIAHALGSFGLHLGQSDVALATARAQLGDAVCIGLSIERYEQVFAPAAQAADYWGVSPIFATPTKQDTQQPWGLQGLMALRRQTTKPLVAIGGIKPIHADALIQAGADSLAVVTGICSAESPAKAAETYRKLIDDALASRPRF
ncbi:thiamine phosphate synthase [Eisenibacter elegans]|uniref:thiamine phosphate synthase n=1 Tax=Eisenibacter elegans TaxID=997 RepID=UPI0003FA6546|nr:thiamine phosphate synthase [Eisenibacter elegans]